MAIAGHQRRPERARPLTGSLGGAALVWDAKSGAELLALKGHATTKVWTATPVNREFTLGITRKKD